MRTITRRVGKLEDQFQVQLSGEPTNCASGYCEYSVEGDARISTCRRTMTTPGSVLEMVELHGDTASSATRSLTGSSPASDRTSPWLAGKMKAVIRRLRQLEEKIAPNLIWLHSELPSRFGNAAPSFGS